MTISIIIPAYNCESFIRKAVESAVAQREVSEIVIVEDGSEDRTLDACKALESDFKEVKLLTHENNKNKGAGASRNKAINNSKNDIIAFLDADDIYLENRFTNDMLILADEEVDGVYNAISAHFAGKAAIEIFPSQQIDNMNGLTTLTERINHKRLFWEMGPIGCKGTFSTDGVTLKRRVFEKVGLFEEGLPVSQDTHMFMKLALLCRLEPGFIDKPLASRGVHGGNRSSDVGRIVENRPYLFRTLNLWATENSLPREVRSTLTKHFVYWSLICLEQKSKISKLKFVFQEAPVYREIEFYKTICKILVGRW